MKEYEPKQLVLLIDRVQFCFYALLKSIELHKSTYKIISDQELIDSPILSMPFHFYREVFMHRLSEIYTFFYLADDKELLNKLSMSEADRMSLRELRHSLAHFPDFEELSARNKNFLENARLSDVAKDMKVIVKHTCALMANEANEYREKLKKEFLFIFSLFPEGMFSKEFKREIIEF